LLADRLRRAARGCRVPCAMICAMFAYCGNAGSQAQSRPKVSASPSRVDLRPRLVSGEILRYQVQLQTITDTKRTGAVSDPQGPSRLAISWDATVRLEVLGVAFIPGSETTLSGGPVRVRTTYERSTATVNNDSPDPQAEDIAQTYTRLEGQAIEFTVEEDGHVSDVKGLEGIIDNDQVRQAAQQWMEQVSGSASAPQGVTLGQTWNSAQPADSMPLAGMIWRSSSSYLRNESCQPGAPTAPVSPGELCAVILTRQSVLPQKQLRDPTPEEYRRNGLRTSGHWSGSGESLSYVSLRTHSAVSVTQDSSQQIDFTVTNASGHSIRYAGTIETHSRVALLPPDASRSQ
jgi:hypothetical protein